MVHFVEVAAMEVELVLTNLSFNCVGSLDTWLGSASITLIPNLSALSLTLLLLIHVHLFFLLPHLLLHLKLLLPVLHLI